MEFTDRASHEKPVLGFYLHKTDEREDGFEVVHEFSQWPRGRCLSRSLTYFQNLQHLHTDPGGGGGGRTRSLYATPPQPPPPPVLKDSGAGSATNKCL